MSRYSGSARGYGDERGRSGGHRHLLSSRRGRRSRSRSESWSLNVRQRRSYHSHRSRSPSPAYVRRHEDYYESRWRSRSPDRRSRGSVGGRRREDEYYVYYDNDDYDDRRRRSSRSRSRPRRDRRSLSRDRSRSRSQRRRSRSPDRRSRTGDGGRRRHEDSDYGYSARETQRRRPSRSRSRPRHHAERSTHRDRGRSVVTVSSRTASGRSDQRPAAQVHYSPDHGQADAEWEGSTQPLEVKSDDSYVDASVTLSCKPGVGSSGSAQRLKSNCYQVSTDISKCSKIFQYDATIELGGESEGGGQAFGGRPLVRPLLGQVVQDAIEQNQDLFQRILVVHDGANALFTPAALPFPNHVGVLNVHSTARNGYGTDPPRVTKGKARSFSFRIRLAKELELEVLQEAYTNPRVVVKPLVYALNAVMKAGFVGTRVESKGNLYSRMDAMGLNGGRVLYKGHHQTVRLGAGSLVLNLDRVWREFYGEGPLLEVVRDAFGARDYGSIRVGDLQETFRLARAVKRLVVRVTHRVTRLQTISGVSDSSAQATMINVDGNSISVEQYFMDRYHVRLRFPELPPVNLGGRRPGSESWVPMELCEVAPDQPYSGPDRSNTASIRTQAVVRPQVRMNGIQRLRESFNFENDPYLKAFGLSVAERMESVGARVLASPGVKYGNGLHYPRNGSWNLQDKTFVKPCTLSNWLLSSAADQTVAVRA